MKHSKKYRFVSLGLFVAFSSLAKADEYHYRNILIGERAGGMGGAYLAISDDPAGMFYNPAGLVYGFENYISGSVINYNSSAITYKDIVPGQNYSLSSQGMVPSFFGFTQSIGKDKFAFAIVIPNSDLQDQDDVLPNISLNTNQVNTLKRKFFRQDTTYYVGPAYSKAFGDKFSVGISVFGYARTVKLIDHLLLTYNPIPTGKYYLTDTSGTSNYYGIVPKLGFQWMVSPKFSFGFVVEKGIGISSNETFRFLRSKTDPTTGLPSQTGSFSNDFETAEVSVSPYQTAPLTTSLGGAYFFNKSWLLAADFYYYFPDPRKPDFNVQATYNLSLGTEYYITEGLVFRAGVYSNRANTPQLQSNQVNQPDHVDLYGGSASFSFLRSGSSFSIGASYTLGAGRGQIIEGTTSTQEVNHTSLSLFLAGSYQL